MHDHAYGNTVSEDLWTELDRDARRPITQIAHDFTLQAGVPMVSEESQRCSDGKTRLDVTQGHFAIDTNSATAKVWHVPAIIAPLSRPATATVVSGAAAQGVELADARPWSSTPARPGTSAATTRAKGWRQSPPPTGAAPGRSTRRVERPQRPRVCGRRTDGRAARAHQKDRRRCRAGGGIRARSAAAEHGRYLPGLCRRRRRFAPMRAASSSRSSGASGGTRNRPKRTTSHCCART